MMVFDQNFELKNRFRPGKTNETTFQFICWLTAVAATASYNQPKRRGTIDKERKFKLLLEISKDRRKQMGSAIFYVARRARIRSG